MSLPSHAVVTASRFVRCQRGLLWVTRQGDGQDHLLRAGQELTGRLVVQALRDSEVELR